MTISVIIPSRNRKRFLYDVLLDLHMQTMKPSEIIVVDQSDEPYTFEDCRCIRDTGIGPCRARNLGISRASGNILVFLDDDVRIDARFIATLCEPIIAGEYVAAVGGICDAQGNYGVSDASRYWDNMHADWLTALTANLGSRNNTLSLGMAAGCCAILKEVIVEVGGFDVFFDPSGTGEDREIALRLFHHGYSIIHRGSARVYHLGAPSGGRRDYSIDLLSSIYKNYLYIVGTYFGPRIFNDYCVTIRLRILRDTMRLDPRAMLRSYRRLHDLETLIKTLRSVIW